MPSCATCGFESEVAFRFCPECGTEAATQEPPRAQRKVVTVLFCDVTGSTELGERLDPERLRSLLARYFEAMKAIVERHGGNVEKFIGDAVMAVFGVPVVHEDDALRAVRAAVEMRQALPGLGLEGRIGVMTGEVVTGTQERLATGDAVNVAARLEQAAQPGEVLIGQPTLALVRETVETAPVEPLVLKGKAAPVAAYRLVRVLHGRERRHRPRFVGRERELALIRAAAERTRVDRCCELVTVVGDAGVGMSEYQERHTVSRLVGAPPGYVGHEEAGQLTEAVRRKPYAVLLFDEIEKAHADVFNILLQILDDGRLTDSHGRTVDFKNTILIMTSNLGADRIEAFARKESGSFDELKEDLMEMLRHSFRPEFINRIDEIIVFQALTMEQLKQITRLMLDRAARRLRAQHIEVEFSDEAVEHLAEIGFDPEFGARPLRRAIQRELENEVSRLLLSGALQPDDRVRVDYDDVQLTFDVEKGAAEAMEEVEEPEPQPAHV